MKPLCDRTVKELREMASKKKIPGRSELNTKRKLINAIQRHMEGSPKKSSPKKSSPVKRERLHSTKKTSTRKTVKKTSPKKSSPKKSSPKKSSPKRASPVKRARLYSSPKKVASPKRKSPKKGSPKRKSPQKGFIPRTYDATVRTFKDLYKAAADTGRDLADAVI